MLAAQQENVIDLRVVRQQIKHLTRKIDGSLDKRYGEKEERQLARSSTKTECLYNQEEIIKVYNVFRWRVSNFTGDKQRIAMRNLTMFIAQINIGLRGGDLCELKWNDVYTSNWEFKTNASFTPMKTSTKVDGIKTGGKKVDLIFNSDFKYFMEEFRKWKIENGYNVAYDGCIFDSKKGGHISNHEWWKVMTEACEAARIPQRVGTQGLRKTMAHQYITAAEDKSEALLEMCEKYNHSNPRVTAIYACIEKEKVAENTEKISFLKNI